ncbi:MAG: Lipopolysaccharide heptosyltransferase I [candidate division TM6 bacterium GW2011_GWF2_28_16]|nr:MAG: Lipopolysaccharide heptosyltransferase I [candidate division TM6 bacterium GW2011_GWF2_28_16]
MNILIIRVSAIGDVVHTLPAIFLIKHLIPESKIDWVVQKKASQLLTNQKFLNQVFVLPDNYLSIKNLTKTIQIIKNIKQNNYDLILDFQGLFKTAVLLYFLNGKKYGFDKNNTRDKFSCYFTDKKITPNYKNIIEKNLSLVTNSLFNLKKITFCPVINHLKNNFNLSIQEQDQNIINSWLNKDNIKNFVLLSPNTTWESKHWPEDSWIKLIKILNLNNNFINNYKIILLGKNFGESAKNIANYFNNNSNNNIVIAPDFNLLQLAYLIKKSKLLIAPDTGLLHLADFLQKNSIGIFGPTKAFKHGPYLHEFNIKNVEQIECPHDYQKSHNNTKIKINIKNSSNILNCMYKLSPEYLAKKIFKIIGE